MVNRRYKLVAGDLSNTKDVINYIKNLQFTNGNGANQANIAFSDNRSISASSTDSLDLAGGLSDVFGNAITFTEIRGIIVYSDPDNGDTLDIGGAASNGFNSWVGASGDAVILRPGGLFVLMATDADGYAVTADTGDLLDITNNDSGGAATYDIIIMGVA